MLCTEPPLQSTRSLDIVMPISVQNEVALQLLFETEEEKAIYAEGEKLMRLRKRALEQSLEKQPPSEAERLVIHDLYLRTLKGNELQPNIVWTENTMLESVRVCQPAERNMYNKV